MRKRSRPTPAANSAVNSNSNSPSDFRSALGPRSAFVDRIVSLLGWVGVLAVACAVGWLVGDIVRLGWSPLTWRMFVEPPEDAGRAGGISTVLVSTALVLSVALAVALPWGVATAAWLSEYTRRGSRAARLVRRSLNLLASVPSIVFGIFGMVFFCQVLQLGFSILAGGLTLAVMILPIIVQATHASLEAVPEELRRGAAALGLRRITTLWHLLLPSAIHGVVIGIVLGIGRALAETAALVFTSGYVTRMPASLFDSGRVLSVHIFDLAMNVPGGERKAYATALVLLALLLVVNVSAQWLTQRWLPTGVSLKV